MAGVQRLLKKVQFQISDETSSGFQSCVRLWIVVSKYQSFNESKDIVIDRCVPYTTNHKLECWSKWRFCQRGRRPEVSWVVVHDEWWRWQFLFEIKDVEVRWLPFLIWNEDGWRHHSPSVAAGLASGWRPCWRGRHLLKLSIIASL